MQKRIEELEINLKEMCNHVLDAEWCSHAGKTRPNCIVCKADTIITKFDN